jgi:hypothetical protein
MSEPNENQKRVIKVPAPTVVNPGSSGFHESDLDDTEGLVSPADIGSASRSCLAIIIILLLIALAICLFLLLQPFVN